MKILIIAGAAAFGLGAVGGTGYRMATAPPRAPVVQSAVVAAEVESGEAPGEEDAAQASPIEGSYNQQTTPIPESVLPSQVSPEAPEAGEAPVTEPAVQERTTAANTAAEPTEGDVAVAAGDGPAEFKQLAKILANMKAAEAGRILEHLTDEQVASVFASMNPRAAALVLAEIPPERGASVGRILAARAKSGK